MPTTRPQPSQSPSRARRKSGGGIGPLFFIMAAIVLAVIVTAVIIGNQPDDKSTVKQPEVIVKNVPVDPKWPQVDPWQGLAVGDSRDHVIELFGNPNKQVITPHGYERLEFYKDPSRAGIFSGTGGSMLTVFVDNKTQKVLYFIPPGAVIKSRP